jgi:pimeloyl-ACP methyl ester carboxylesterase
MSLQAQTLRPPSKLLLLLEGRAVQELGAFFASLPLLSLTAKGDRHPVLVLPGLITSDASTRPLRAFLENHGYAVSGWGMGRNYGLREGVQHGMLDLVRRIVDEHGRKLSIVGWSLGGLYARQLAKMLPDHVRSVITLGSPFAGSPKATNAWRVYELASGQRAEDAHVDSDFGGSLADTPPVPTTAIFSRSDGVCAWQVCIEKPAAFSENIEVYGSHCGLGHHPAVVYAVADRLAQPDDAWQPFDRGGWRGLVFPDPARQ